MSAQYLYIAQERHKPGVLKVGQTTKSPHQRRTALRGQADTDFDLLRVFPTDNCKLAERLTHLQLDKAGGRQGRNARRELFGVSLELASDVCQAAAKQASRTPAPRPSAAAKQWRSAHRLSSTSAFWSEMLGLPVRFAGTLLPLGELMALALEDASAARRLAQFEITCIAFRHKRPEFRVVWTPGSALAQWVRQRGLSPEPRPYAAETVTLNRTPAR